MEDECLLSAATSGDSVNEELVAASSCSAVTCFDMELLSAATSSGSHHHDATGCLHPKGSKRARGLLVVAIANWTEVYSLSGA